MADRWHLLANLSSAVKRSSAATRPACETNPSARFRFCRRPNPTGTWGVGPSDRPAAAAGPAHARPRLDDQRDRPRAQPRPENGTPLRSQHRGGVRGHGIRRHTLIDAFIPYLRKRWEEGCVNAATLYTEIVAQGFRGSAQTVRHRLQRWRLACAPAESRAALTPRKVTGWIMRRPDELTDNQRDQLQQILDRSEEIATAHRLAADFAHLLRQRRGSDLDTWAHQAEACGVREIRSFATTLRQDWDAVVAGLTLSHSNGATEGNVNRLKLIKRAM